MHESGLVERGALDYDWAGQIGSIDRGKFADIIAVSGNPLADVTEMDRVKFRHEGRRRDP
jgi:imidazolonepropionase-like amidohydrolase